MVQVTRISGWSCDRAVKKNRLGTAIFIRYPTLLEDGTAFVKICTWSIGSSCLSLTACKELWRNCILTSVRIDVNYSRMHTGRVESQPIVTAFAQLHRTNLCKGYVRWNSFNNFGRELFTIKPGQLQVAIRLTKDVASFDVPTIRLMCVWSIASTGMGRLLLRNILHLLSDESVVFRKGDRTHGSGLL